MRRERFSCEATVPSLTSPFASVHRRAKGDPRRILRRHPRDMIDVSKDLFTDLLALPGGVFTRRDALRVGLRDRVIASALRRGLITRVCRGVYAAPGPWSVEEHRRTLAVAALRAYEDGVLVGASAVAAHGVPLYRVPVLPGDIARPVAREARTAQLRIRPLRHPVVTTDWGPASDLPSSLAQLTMDHGIISGVASIDAALHGGLVTEGQMRETLERVSGWPHSSRLRCALAWADGRAESMGESVTRAILLGAGFDMDSHVPVAGRDGHVFAYADLGVVGTGVLLEFDGKVKYTDGGSDALFREKKREDRIRARGYRVIRVTWADLYHPELIVRAVREALAAAA